MPFTWTGKAISLTLDDFIPDLELAELNIQICGICLLCGSHAGYPHKYARTELFMRMEII